MTATVVRRSGQWASTDEDKGTVVGPPWLTRGASVSLPVGRHRQTDEPPVERGGRAREKCAGPSTVSQHICRLPLTAARPPLLDCPCFPLQTDRQSANRHSTPFVPPSRIIATTSPSPSPPPLIHTALLRSPPVTPCSGHERGRGIIRRPVRVSGQRYSDSSDESQAPAMHDHLLVARLIVLLLTACLL
jgi:hypothetical protein